MAADNLLALILGPTHKLTQSLLHERRWGVISHNRWWSPKGEQVEFVSHPESLYSCVRKTKLYRLPGWGLNYHAKEILHIAKRRDFELVDLT